MTAALLFLQAATAVALGWMASRKHVSPILAVSFILSFLLWYVAPVATLFVAPDRVLPRMYVSVDAFLRQALIETAAFLLALLGFAAGPRTFRSIVGGRLASHRLTPTQYVCAVVAGALLFLVVRRSILAITGSTYFEINAFNVVSEGSSAAGQVGLLAFAESVLLAFSYACAVTPLPRHKAVNFLVWAWIVGGSLSVVLIGGRLALLTPVALLIMLLHVRHRSRAALAGAYTILFAVTAVVGIVVTIAIANARGEQAITLSEAERQSKIVVGEHSQIRDHLWEAFDHINLKFDRISAGVLLLEKYGVATAGTKPYVGALLALVPRRIVPSKPVPGSVDGTNRGTPSRLAAVAIGYDPDYGNVGMSPAAIAMWQFGVLGILPLVILNVLQLRLINSLLLPPSIATRTLAMFLLGIPAFEAVFSPADLLIMNLERMIAVYAAATLALSIAAYVRRPRLPRVVAASASQ